VPTIKDDSHGAAVVTRYKMRSYRRDTALQGAL